MKKKLLYIKKSTYPVLIDRQYRETGERVETVRTGEQEQEGGTQEVLRFRQNEAETVEEWEARGEEVVPRDEE